MAFRLKQRPIAGQLRRLVRKQFDAAIDALDVSRASATRTHDARTHMKKVRAIVKLLRDPLGQRYSPENARLREAGRRLSGLRDADVMLETFESLHGRLVTVITPTVERRVARGLGQQRRDAHKEADGLAKEALRFLKKSRTTLPDRVGRAAGFRVVRRGVTRGYKRAKSAMAGLTNLSSADDFHAWRRSVKSHWYHMRLFTSRQRDTLARSRRLERLQSDLGDDHNLAVLSERLLAHPDRFGGARTSALVARCIQAQQRAVRRRALASGRRLFASRADHIGRTVDAWHTASR